MELKDIGSSCIVYITPFLDARSIFNLYHTCKVIHDDLLTPTVKIKQTATKIQRWYKNSRQCIIHNNVSQLFYPKLKLRKIFYEYHQLFTPTPNLLPQPIPQWTVELLLLHGIPPNKIVEYNIGNVEYKHWRTLLISLNIPRSTYMQAGW